MFRSYNIKYNKKTKMYHLIYNGGTKNGKPSKGFATVKELCKTRDGMIYFAVSDKPYGKSYIVDAHGKYFMGSKTKYDMIVAIEDQRLPSAILIDNVLERVSLMTFENGVIHQPIDIRSKSGVIKHYQFKVFRPTREKMIFVVEDIPMDYYEFIDHMKKVYSPFSMRRYKNIKLANMMHGSLIDEIKCSITTHVEKLSYRIDEASFLFGTGFVDNCNINSN